MKYIKIIGWILFTALCLTATRYSYNAGYKKGLKAAPTKEVIKYVDVKNDKETDKKAVPKNTTEDTTQNNTGLISLGVFSSSAYCNENYYHDCNDGTPETTATGTAPTAGRTIAVDPSVIPLGSEVIISGHTYIAEDTGGAIKGKRIDIVFNSHEEALNWGRRNVEVFIKR